MKITRGIVSVLCLVLLQSCVDSPGLSTLELEPGQMSPSHTEEVDALDIFFVNFETDDWRIYRNKYIAVTSKFPNHKYLDRFKSELLWKLLNQSDFLIAEDVTCDLAWQFAQAYDDLGHSYPKENYRLLNYIYENCGYEGNSNISSMAANAYEKAQSDLPWRREIAKSTKGTRAHGGAVRSVEAYEHYMPRLLELTY